MHWGASLGHSNPMHGFGRQVEFAQNWAVGQGSASEHSGEGRRRDGAGWIHTVSLLPVHGVVGHRVALRCLRMRA